MKNATYSQILDVLAKDQIPEGLDLAPKILAQIQNRNGAHMKTRMKILLPSLFILATFGVITSTVPAVAHTIQRWIGYVPGFGLTNDTKLRTLAEPVNINIDNFTLTIQGVTANSEKTVVKFGFLGVKDNSALENACPGDQFLPVISTQGGSELELQGLDSNTDSGDYQFEVTYSAIPAVTQDITFSLQCDWETGSGKNTRKFQVPLHLIEDGTKPALTVAPVIDIPIATPQSDQDGSDLNPGIEVNQIIPLQDGYILSGNLTVESVTGLTVYEEDVYLDDFTVVDANNQPVVTSPAPDDYRISSGAMANNVVNWAFQISGSKTAWPLTITVNSVSAFTEPYSPGSFTVDVGENPQPGEVWPLIKEVPLGPKTVHVVSLKRLMFDTGFDGYEFTFEYDPTIDFSFEIEGVNATGGGGSGGGGGGSEPRGFFTLARSYLGNIPTGQLTIVLNGQGIEKINGPWQVIVDEPAVP